VLTSDTAESGRTPFVAFKNSLVSAIRLASKLTADPTGWATTPVLSLDMDDADDPDDSDVYFHDPYGK
jgi:hypothetical protein